MRSYETDAALTPGPNVATVARRHDDEATASKALSAGRRDVLSPSAVLHLQRAAGNAGVSGLLEGEREPEPAEAHSPVKDVVGSGRGQPLDNPTRDFMEARFGTDFSDVRIHTDAQATQSAKAVQAHAYTVGTDVVFQGDQYSPGTDTGKRMLAHELTHVVQQKSGPVDGTPAPGGINLSHPSDRFEQEAEHTADRVMSTPADVGPTSATTATSSAQRQASEEEEPVQTLAVQRQAGPAPEEEEEPVQTLAMQRQAGPAPEEEEEPVQTLAVQRQAGPAPEEEEEPVQTLAVQRQEMAPEEEEQPAPA